MVQASSNIVPLGHLVLVGDTPNRSSSTKSAQSPCNSGLGATVAAAGLASSMATGCDARSEIRQACGIGASMIPGAEEAAPVLIPLGTGIGVLAGQWYGAYVGYKAIDKFCKD
jgi:hypothetical protein